MKTVNKIICLIFALIICVSCFPLSVFAAVENPMHSTYVCDDLLNMGYTDYATEYPVDLSDDNVYIIDFTEYGYDANGDQRYYGIYIYLYNPSGRPIQTNGNSIEMSYINTSNFQTKYANYTLLPLSYSSDGYNDYVYYKFVVVSSSDFVKDIRKGVRSYSVSSIEVKYDGSVGAKPESFTVGGTYTFQGYQKNFGIRDTDIDTLHRTYEQFDVCDIELHPASWFTQTSDLGEDYRYELSSVYFAIPNYYIRKYGNIADKPSDGGTSGLYSVQGEYYKYVTNGIMTSNSVAYTNLLAFQNKWLPFEDNYQDGTVGVIGFFENRKYVPSSSGFSITYDFSYNMSSLNYRDITGYYMYKESRDKIFHLCNSLITYNKDKPYVSQDSFLSQYNSQGRVFYGDTYSLVDKNADIFSNLGYIEFDISLYDKNNKKISLSDGFKTYASTHTKWYHKIGNKDLFVDENGYSDCAPIYEVIDSDVSFNDTNKTFKADELFIMEDDLSKLQTFYNEKDFGNHVYLLRLEVNPYYCVPVEITTDTNNGSSVLADGYYFEKSIFHDVDILQFTFRDADSNFHTVPVSCKPVDIVGSIIPGNNNITDNNGNPQQGFFEELFGGDKEVDWFSLVKLVIALVVIMFLIWLVWRVFGGMIIGVTELGIKASDSRTRRRQQKIDSYETEKKIKADKEKKRESKQRLKRQKAEQRKANSAEEKAKMDEIYKNLDETGRPFKGQREAEEKNKKRKRSNK